MKLYSRLLCILFLEATCLHLHAETWYIRSDGGSRFSANMRKGQCDGKADAAYPGHGTNQHCAFNDYRYLYDDQSYGDWSKQHWVIAGGDTVIIDNTKQWRVGFDHGTGTDPWCLGGNGPYGCRNPTIPAGTPSQHTRILGRNYQNCPQSKMSQIFGGFGLGVVLNLSGAQYVDVACLEITRHSQCITHGEPRIPSACNTSGPLDDYDSDGVGTNVDTRDVTLTDVWIHGHTDRGVIGPIGGVVTCIRCDIAYNGMSGWDFDDGSGTHMGPAAVWNFRNSIIEWSGCNQEYPATHPNPVASCYGQSSGGYGDGVGTPPGTGLSVNVDQSIFRYNTQDGLDLGHVDAGNHSLTITNSEAYGNGGGTFKWGANMTKVIFINNLVLANCARMSAPMSGTPTGYNAHLGDFCRAEDNLSFNFRQGGTVFFANNTIVSYAPTTIDTQCWDAPGAGGTDTGCTNSTFIFKNNIILGYDNPATYNLGGKEGGPGFIFYRDKIGHVERSNNIFYGMRGNRLQIVVSGEKYDDPKFVSEPPRFTKEQDLDSFNFHLSPNSPAKGTGARLPEVRTDRDGKPRPDTGGYDIGAYQF